MSNRQKHFEDTLMAIGMGTLLAGATYGVYSYPRGTQEAYTHASSSARQKTKQRSVREFHQCPICFEAMTSRISTFTCHHSFHKKCIGQWQAISKTCPVCRMPFDE